MSKLEDIINKYCSKLPQLPAESDFFPGFLFNHLQQYYAEIEASTKLLDIEYSTEEYVDSEDDFKKSVLDVTQSIQDAISAYLNGSPAKAYRVFADSIKATYLHVALKTAQVRTIKKGASFFRIRQGNIDGTPPHFIELFHIPFEKRRLVSAQRFSIPGFPCLYAGNSLAVSCKEIDIFTDEDLNSAKVVRLSNFGNLIIIDIDPFNLTSNHVPGAFGKNAKGAVHLYRSAILYPLIAACHFKVKYSKKQVPFKVEYIIPQLLLQWYKNSPDYALISGLRYLSNRLDTGDIRTNMYNYVFPAKDTDKEKGHCSSLLSLFGSTEIVDVSKYSFHSTLFSEKVLELEAYLNSQPVTSYLASTKA